MSHWIVNLKPGQRAVFLVRGDDMAPHLADAAVDVNNESGGLVIRDIACAIIALRGRGMSSRISRKRTEPPKAEPHKEVMRPGDTVQVTVPEMLYRTCVYIEAWEDGFTLTGGADIIARIEGDSILCGVEMEPDDPSDGQVAHCSPRAGQAASRIRRRKPRS